MIAGVPTFHELRGWIGDVASPYGISHLADASFCSPASLMGDPQALRRRVAASQWTVEEVAHGDAFRALLGGT